MSEPTRERLEKIATDAGCECPDAHDSDQCTGECRGALCDALIWCQGDLRDSERARRNEGAQANRYVREVERLTNALDDGHRKIEDAFKRKRELCVEYLARAEKAEAERFKAREDGITLKDEAAALIVERDALRERVGRRGKLLKACLTLTKTILAKSEGQTLVITRQMDEVIRDEIKDD